MLHVRKSLSKKERAEWLKWKERHKNSLRELPLNPEDYWTRQTREQNLRSTLRTSTAHLPSLRDVPPEPIKVDPLLMIDPEHREEYRKREAIARAETEEKKNRTAPAYNKGGAVYWTEEAAKEFSTGAHRRRP